MKHHCMWLTRIHSVPDAEVAVAAEFVLGDFAVFADIADLFLISSASSSDIRKVKGVNYVSNKKLKQKTVHWSNIISNNNLTSLL